jgi:hypothetical protein
MIILSDSQVHMCLLKGKSLPKMKMFCCKQVIYLPKKVEKVNGCLKNKNGINEQFLVDKRG